jgi:hypothetical protein
MQRNYFVESYFSAYSTDSESASNFPLFFEKKFLKVQTDDHFLQTLMPNAHETAQFLKIYKLNLV